MMDTSERVIRRGDVYYLRSEDSFGSEMALGRPVVIVSSNTGNESSPVVNCVFLTTAPKFLSVCPEINGTKRRSWALCSQLVTVDKKRLGDKLCSLTSFEMGKINKALLEVLGLEVTENNTELEEKEKEIEALKDEVLNQKVEYAFYQKAYDKVLDQLAALRIELDLLKRSAPVEPEKEEPVIEEVEAVEVEPKEAPVEPELVNINTASFDELKRLGFSDNICLNIISGRPYLKEDDLRIIPGVTRIAFQLVERKITVGDTSAYIKKKPVETPVVVEATGLEKEEPKPKRRKKETTKASDKPLKMVNINTATAFDLSNEFGLGRDTAVEIVRTRNKNGRFTCMEEIAAIRRMGRNNLRKIQGRIVFE